MRTKSRLVLLFLAVSFLFITEVHLAVAGDCSSACSDNSESAGCRACVSGEPGNNGWNASTPP